MFHVKRISYMRVVRGFSLFDMVLALLIVAVVTYGVIDMLNYYAKQVRATEYATQTRNYVNLFIEAIFANYNQYYNLLQNNSVVTLSYNDVESLNIGAPFPINMYKQAPCVGLVMNNSTNTMQGVLYYLTPESTNLSMDVSNMAIMDLGADAGIVEESYALGTAGSWQIPLNSPEFSGASTCESGFLVNNSIVINLSLNQLSGYAQHNAQDKSLHRVPDNINPIGSSSNTNTMQTDIIINSSNSNNGIYFDNQVNSNSLYMTTGDNPKLESMNDKNAYTGNAKDLVIANGNLVADTLTPSSSELTFDACSSGEIGKMAQQGDVDIVIKSQLQCTYNPLQCQGVDPKGRELNDYCYLPINEVAVTYHPNRNMFTCPEGYIDSSVPIQVTSGNPPANFNGYVWQCWSWVLGICVNWEKVFKPMCSWASPDCSYMYVESSSKHYGPYSVNTEAEASCAWGQNSNGYSCNYANKTNIGPGVLSSVTCTTTNPVIDYHGPGE